MHSFGVILCALYVNNTVLLLPLLHMWYKREGEEWRIRTGKAPHTLDHYADLIRPCLTGCESMEWRRGKAAGFPRALLLSCQPLVILSGLQAWFTHSLIDSPGALLSIPLAPTVLSVIVTMFTITSRRIHVSIHVAMSTNLHKSVSEVAQLWAFNASTPEPSH